LKLTLLEEGISFATELLVEHEVGGYWQWSTTYSETTREQSFVRE